MKIKGQYQKKILEFVDCTVLFKYGKVQQIQFNSRPVFNTYRIKNKSEFEVDKIPPELPQLPADYNYKLNYLNIHDDPSVIYLRLNWIQVQRLNWQLKSLDWYRIIPIILAIFFGILNIYQKYDYNNLKRQNNSLKIERDSLKDVLSVLNNKMIQNKEVQKLDTLQTNDLTDKK